MSNEISITAASPPRAERVSEKNMPREPDQVREAIVVDEAELDSIVKDINSAVQNINRELMFSVDKDIGETIIQVKDKDTDEIIRQIPAKQMLAMRKSIEESLKGIMFNDNA